ncbi:transposase [Actinoallomurus acaciae]|uniref:Transposase n=1 Tax=Actinoallomurus acaciae TaxID=502577 RepID=A0ABV5YP87_9ACTN
MTPWDADGLGDEVRAYAMEHVADVRAVLIADPTGFAKKGTKSGRGAAAVPRDAGTLGRIDNCQMGTFLAYATPAGNRVLIDRELYLPERSWCDDPGRRAEAKVPEEARFATRPQQVTAMITRTVAAGVPFAWFAADEEFGQKRWPIEECFEAAKQEAGLDQYQFRLYPAGYRHITLAMLALGFLAVLRRTPKREPTPYGQPAAPQSTHPAEHHEPHQTAGRLPHHPGRRLIALTIGEIRRLFNLTDKDDHTGEPGLYWSTHRRNHQAQARRHHFRRLRLQVLQI